MKRLAFLLLPTLILIACVASVGQQLEQSALLSTLSVNNEYREPVHVYVEHAGTRTRQLGVVESFSRGVFRLQRADAYAGSLQLLIVAYTDGTTVRTDAVPVAEGQSLALDFGPMRGQQFLYVRPSAAP